MMATSAARAAVRAGSPIASGATMLAARSAIVVSGPTITRRDGVSSRKIAIEPIAA